MRMESQEVFEGTRLLPFAAGLYRNKYLETVRHTFFLMMPFLLAVYALDILGSLVPEPYMLSCRRIVGLGYGMLSMALAMLLAGKLARLWRADSILAAFCALTAFLFLTPPPSEVSKDLVDFFAGRSFLSAFLAAVLSARLFAWLFSIRRLRLPIPKVIPKRFSRYLSAILPVLLTITVLGILSVGMGYLMKCLEEWIRTAVPMSFFQHPAVAFLYQTILWVCWWFGFPGYGVASFFQQTVYIPAQLSNQAGDTDFIFTSGFFEAGVMHVFGLMIAILVFSRHESWRSITKVSFPAMIFNIQDPVMFCLPVVLNPVFLIPYLLAPLAHTVVGWIAISWGIVPVFKASLPWTMPILFSGSLGTGSFMGGVLQAVWLVMDIFIYAPFVITANMLDLKAEEGEDG